MIMSNNLNFNAGGQPFQRAVPVQEIRRQLLSRLPSVLQYLFPNGKVRNHVFQVGNVEGTKGESLKIEMQAPKAGMWQDFATNEGGDIFELWGKVRNIDAKNDFPRLMEEIKNWLGVYTPFQTPIKSINSPANKNATNDNLSKPSAEWSYTDLHGKIIAKKLRYDVNGKKSYLPWDEERKAYKMPKNRPLYNLPGIAKSNEVILVEGEKCAQSLIDAGICATTAMGGANASIDKTDWSPLKGKHLIIWPDNDEPGKRYAFNAQHFLLQQGVASAKIIDIPEGKRDKWDAADAIKEGIDVKAFIEQAEFCDIADNTGTNKVANDNDKIERINIKGLIGIPPEREWIIPDWLPKGCVTTIYGDGGVGKSLLVQQLMTAVSTGKEWLGYTNKPMKVYGLLCEDDEKELWRRQYKINKQLGLEMPDLENVAYISRVGNDNLLMTFGDKDVGKLSNFFHKLAKDIQEFKPDLVVLDTAADLFGGNENNRTHVRQFIQNCCAKIARDANSAVLICAHPSDSGLQRKTGTGGSTAWNNTVRSRWYFEWSEDSSAPTGMRELSLKKSNYSASQVKIFVNWYNGIFIIEDNYTSLTDVMKRASKWDDVRDAKSNEILGIIYGEACENGRAYTMNAFCEAFEGSGENKFGSKRAINDRLTVLAAKGFIKFFQNWQEYDLPKLPTTGSGYMWIKNMRLKVKNKGQISVHPTHYKCRLSGKLEEIKND